MEAPEDPPEQSPERRRLTRLIEQRAGELDLDWNEVAELAGLTKQGLHGVRFGSGRMRVKTKGGIERALSWKAGSVNSILAGGDPTAVREQSPMDAAEAQLAENERMAARLRGRKAAELAERIERLSPRKREAVEQMIEALEDDPPTSETR